MALSIPGVAVVGGVVVLTGFLGGLRNWLTEPTEEKRAADMRRLFARLTDGIVAAATVPLFLSIIGNEKANAALGVVRVWDSGYQSSLLILVGFCVLAAVYSHKFLETLSSKILNELKSEVKDVKAKVDENTVVTDTLVEGDKESPNILQIQLSDPANVSKDEVLIVKALWNGNFLLRSERGLCGSTGLPQPRVLDALSTLEIKGYVSPLSTTKGRRWALTDSGRMAAAV